MQRHAPFAPGADDDPPLAAALPPPSFRGGQASPFSQCAVEKMIASVPAPQLLGSETGAQLRSLLTAGAVAGPTLIEAYQRTYRAQLVPQDHGVPNVRQLLLRDAHLHGIVAEKRGAGLANLWLSLADAPDVGVEPASGVTSNRDGVPRVAALPPPGSPFLTPPTASGGPGSSGGAAGGGRNRHAAEPDAAAFARGLVIHPSAHGAGSSGAGGFKGPGAEAVTLGSLRTNKGAVPNQGDA